MKKEIFNNVDSGRYWLFVYDMDFKGFFETRSYEYFMSNVDGSKVICLDDEQKKQLLMEIKNDKSPSEVSLERYDDIGMVVEESVESRKEELSAMAMGKNNVKIGSRIQALNNLSNIRIRNLENDLVGAYGKDEEKIRKAIDREKKKLSDKIAILEEKMKYVGTYALDAVCLIDVV